MRRFVVLVSCLLATAAQAQLDLSGATAPAPAGTVVTPAPVKPRAPRAPKIAPASATNEVTLAGKTLALDGGRSQISFAPRDKTVEISRLLLSGHKISNGREECQVDVAGAPLAVTPVGKSNGISRFSVSLPACPLSFDVLNGAVLTTGETTACQFKDADCQASVAGLWGVQPGSIGPDQVKVIERERMAAEKAVLAAYRGLVTSTKDRAFIRDAASDQAGFSSRREEICRNYIGESRHGFCASRLTQQRATILDAELTVAQAAKEARKKKGGRAARQ